MTQPHLDNNAVNFIELPGFTNMPFLTLGLVVLPWVTSAAGRLVRSVLELNPASSERTNLEEPVPQASHQDECVPPPALTKARNYRALRLLYPNPDYTGLACFSNETQQREREQDGASVHSPDFIHRKDVRIGTGWPRPHGHYLFRPRLLRKKKPPLVELGNKQ